MNPTKAATKRPARNRKSARSAPKLPADRREARARAREIVTRAKLRADREHQKAMSSRRQVSEDFWATHGSPFGLTPEEAVERHTNAKPAKRAVRRRRAEKKTMARRQHRRALAVARKQARQQLSSWRREMKAAGTW